MKHKILLTSLLGLTIVCPAMAEVNVDITAGTNNPGCNNTVLHTYSGPTSLEADYTANTINLNFYSDENTVYSTGTCTYDGGIELPSEDPTRTGYTFDGWQVRRAAANNNNQSGGNNQTPITLSSLYSSETINVFSSKSLNPGVYCEGSSGWDEENEDYLWYGTDEGGSCSDSAFTGLNNGEWRVTMPNGSVVKGEARCSTVEGEWATSGNPTDDLDLNDLENGAGYCWCKATSADSGNGYQPVSSSSWVFDDDVGNVGDCAARCAISCAGVVYGGGDFRRAVFGVAGD